MGFSSSSSGDFFEAVLRRIARGAEFQYRLAGCDGNACALFGVANGYELTEQQLSLYQWGKWYKSLYEMPMTDKPDDRVIEDDHALDTWFKLFQREQARKLGRNAGNGSFEAITREKTETIKLFDGGDG